MTDQEKINELAETLKSRGLAASMADAVEKAQNIIGGIKPKKEEPKVEVKESVEVKENLVDETKTTQKDVSEELKEVEKESAELEVKQADFKLKQVEQQTILDTVSSYFDFIFKTKNEEFNLSNVNLFERQVESDSARLQKGEITLTDLAQSESSLAGASAKLITARNELVSGKKNFQKIIRV